MPTNDITNLVYVIGMGETAYQTHAHLYAALTYGVPIGITLYMLSRIVRWMKAVSGER